MRRLTWSKDEEFRILPPPRASVQAFKRSGFVLEICQGRYTHCETATAPVRNRAQFSECTHGPPALLSAARVANDKFNQNMPCRKSTEKGADFWRQFSRSSVRANCNMIPSGQIIVRGLLVRGDGQLICNSDQKESAVLSARSNTIGDPPGLLNLMLINKEQRQQQPG